MIHKEFFSLLPKRISSSVSASPGNHSLPGCLSAEMQSSTVVQELCKGAAIRCGSSSAMQPGAMSHDGLVAILPPYCTIFVLHLTFAKTGKKQTVFVHRCSKTMPEHNED